MSDSATATADQVERTEVEQAVYDLRVKIEDGAVRTARLHGYCSQFHEAMMAVFPEGSVYGGERFLDSDGYDCKGYGRDGFSDAGWDPEGYGRNGFHVTTGRNREGFNRAGYDRRGFNAEGVNVAGIHKDSDEYRATFRFDHRGYDADGYDRNGRDRNGYTRDERAAACPYDADGYDANGVNYNGYNREGNYVGRND